MGDAMAEADADYSTRFRIAPDKWTPLQAAIDQYMARWGQSKLTLRALDAALVTRRLRSAYIRLPERYIKYADGHIGPFVFPTPEGAVSYMTVPAEEESGEIEDAEDFWTNQFPLGSGSDGIWRVVPQPETGLRMLGFWSFFVLKSDLDAIFASADDDEPPTTKVDRAARRIQEMYGCPPREISKEQAGTAEVRDRINLGEDRTKHFLYDTVDRALGRRKT
jgi:hypothetical protein